MRAVLDTNVIVSAVLSPAGSPRAVLEAWRDGQFEMVVSPRLLAELSRVLAYPKLRRFITDRQSEDLLSFVQDASVLGDDPDDPPPVESPDPDDDYLIALAAATRSLLITGDADLLGLSGRIPVFSPARFLEILGEPDSP